MISKELEGTLNIGIERSEEQAHEYVCLEHLLYALLQDKDASGAIINCGGDIDRLRKASRGVFQRPNGCSSRRSGPRAAADARLSPGFAESGYPCSIGGKKGNQRGQPTDRDVS